MRTGMLLLLIILGALGLLLTSGCGEGDAETAESGAVAVRTADVRWENIALPIRSSGVLSATEEAYLSFTTGGIIDHFAVDGGDRVSRGQLLARLDLAEIDARLEKARSAFDKADRDYRRMQNLYADSVVTLEQLQNAETARHVARSDMTIAEFNKMHSTITAPSDGVILRRMAEENEIVSPGHPVFKFGATDGSWLVTVSIADRDVVRLRYGDSAVVFFDAFPGDSIRATVTRIAEGANPRTGTYEVELTLVSNDRALKSGFVAVVIVTPSLAERRATVPIEALYEAEATEGYVFVPSQQSTTAIKTPVTIGSIYKNRVVITSGLETATEVITAGASYLTDGADIMLIVDR